MVVEQILCFVSCCEDETNGFRKTKWDIYICSLAIPQRVHHTGNVLLGPGDTSLGCVYVMDARVVSKSNRASLYYVLWRCP